jgi:hypothetical protein
MIILSDDKDNVAYAGLDAQDSFRPLNFDGFESHSISAGSSNATHPGYLERIQSLVAEYTKKSYPVVSNGFVAGSLCSKDIECASKNCTRDTSLSSYKRCVGTACKLDSDCTANRCVSGLCAAKLGSCQICTEHTDCLHEKCSTAFRCTGSGGFLDNDCLCVFGSECRSGRCEGINPRVCEARLGLGSYCNEATDCLSGRCSWKFHCVESKPSAPWWASKPILGLLGSISGEVVAEGENVEDGQNDAKINSDSGESNIRRHFGIVVGLIVAAIIVWFHRHRLLRRRGYENIPASLTV